MGLRLNSGMQFTFKITKIFTISFLCYALGILFNILHNIFSFNLIETSPLFYTMKYRKKLIIQTFPPWDQKQTTPGSTENSLLFNS